MALAPQIEALKQAAHRFRSLNRERLLRAELGSKSLEKEVTPILNAIERRVEAATRFAHVVPEGAIQSTTHAIERLVDTVEAIASHNDPDFLHQRERSLQSIENCLGVISSTMGHFVHAAMIDLDLFGLDDKQRELVRAIDDRMAELTEEARKITVNEAEAEFKAASDHHRNQAWLWALLGAAALVAFFGFALSSYDKALEEAYQGWRGIHVTALRLTILAAIAGISAFCMRVLRSQLHLHQLNSHRRRLAVSIPALIRAAETPAQRDQIVLRVVDALASFGTSGLIRGSDDPEFEGIRGTEFEGQSP